MKKNWAIGVAAILIAALLGAWALGWFSGKKYNDDPAVAKLERQRDEAFARGLPKEPSRKERDAFRQQMEGLTEEQRQAFWESSAPIFVPMMAKAFEDRYDKFMALSPQEQQKELDKEIDRAESRGGAEGGRGGGPQNVDPKKMAEFVKKMNAWTTPQQRAKFENGIRIFNERRKARGLSPAGPGGGGGGFF